MTDEERIRRCQAIPSEIRQVRRLLVQIAAERARLVWELRQSGHGLGWIADQLGITKGRVQQLSKAHETMSKVVV